MFALPGPHALIVEDEVLIALGLKADLEALGFEISGLAPNAKQAISLAMNDKPDLVVMDIYLNGARILMVLATALKQRDPFVRYLERRSFM
jgi:YesN/AraC family two-component response regulator